MAGGSIFAGMFNEPYDIKDFHSKVGVAGILTLATVLIFFIADPFDGLIYSQMFLSIQLPITVFIQLYLTSSKKVMGKYRNSMLDNVLIWIIAIIANHYYRTEYYALCKLYSSKRADIQFVAVVSSILILHSQHGL